MDKSKVIRPHFTNDGARNGQDKIVSAVSQRCDEQGMFLRACPKGIFWGDYYAMK